VTTSTVNEKQQTTFVADASLSEWIFGTSTLISAASGSGIYEAPDLRENVYQIKGYAGSVIAQGLLMFGSNAHVVIDRGATLFGGGTDGA
jgi:hypothetical protein